MFVPFINPMVITFALSTAFGVFWHDTRLDKAAAMSMSTPVVMANHETNTRAPISLTGDLHTHTERGSLAQAVNDLKSQNPRIQPRSNEDKKHLLQKNVARGHHAFDNYNLPIV